MSVDVQKPQQPAAAHVQIVSQKCSTGAGRRCAGRLGRHPSSSPLCSSALPAASVTRAVSYEGGTTLEELVAGHGSGSCERSPCACAWRRNGASEVEVRASACEVRARCQQGASEVVARCERGASEVRARYGRDAALGLARRRVAQGSAEGPSAKGCSPKGRCRGDIGEI